MKHKIIRYSKSIIALLMIVLCGVEASASTSWTVNPGDFRYDMSLYLDVSFGNVAMDYSKYEVAAFVGDECRGVAEPISFGGNRRCLYLRARSNRENGEKMTFRYRSAATGEEAQVDGVDFTFESNGRLGYPSDPFIVRIVRHFDVAISASSGGSVNTTGGRIAEGTILELTATPDEGHHFTGWSDGSTENPRQISVGDNIELTAEFGVNSYTLAYTLDGEPYKSSTVDFGSAITPEPEPVKEGYTFSGWEGLPQTMPAHDVTVGGSFSINSYKAVFKIGDQVIETKTVVFGEAVTAPDAPAKEGHTFTGWQNLPEKMPARDLEISGSYTVNSYTLAYTLDGKPYKSSSVDFGSAIIPEPDPVKEGYSFSGWEGLPETMPARDVTVSGSFSINSYKTVFKIGDQVIETKTIVFGEAVTAPEAPAKEGHTFAGWQNVPEKMPARDIEISGSYTVNSYKLTYMLDGESYKSSDVVFGSAITPEPDPVKEGHTFSGWEGLPETMPARDVTVSGSFSINSYKAVFKIGDQVIETKTIVFGEAVTAPEAPAKEGHTFAGWQNVPEKMPARDIEISSSYTVNSYKLTYMLDGESYKSSDVDFGSAITPEPDPVKEGYSFSGWKGLPETMPARDVTVSGSFSINSYKAVFKIGDQVIETKTTVFGEAVTAPEAPAKEGHTFAGWQNMPETMPARDIEISGSYTVNSYTLTYMLDGERYDSIDLEFGAAIPDKTPEKEGYSFSGWEGLPETMPARDVTVSGSFSINSYKAVFKIGDQVIETKTIVFGEAVTAPEAPAKEGHTFAGWQNLPEKMPARDIEISGSYTVNSYTLTYTLDGEPYDTVELEFGATIPDKTPVKEGHTFSGWEGLPETMPARDLTVSGSFSINSYKAVFKIGDQVIETKTIVFGEAVTAPEAPAKEGHTFAGWQNMPETMPARDIEISGSYTVNSYTLTYMIDGELYDTVELEFGTAIPDKTPEKEGYTFSGWEGLPETMPARDVTVSGSFSINSYTLTIYLNGELYDSQEIEFGSPLSIDDPEVPEGMIFNGWDEEIPETMPAHDLEIHGSYILKNGIAMIEIDDDVTVTVSTISGIVLHHNTPWCEVRSNLSAGLYIINGSKYLIR